MNFNEYQRLAFTLSLYPTSFKEGLMCYALGLNGESGEVAEKVKKYIRDDVPKKIVKEQVMKEAGDVLWYLAGICSHIGVSLEDIASMNLNKLLDRKERGVLNGSGDER